MNFKFFKIIKILGERKNFCTVTVFRNKFSLQLGTKLINITILITRNKWFVFYFRWTNRNSSVKRLKLIHPCRIS